MLPLKSIWCVVFALGLSLAGARGASTWYVAPDGKDDAAGSLEAPFGSVQRAQKAVQAGDTVFIRGGTYRLKEAQITRKRGIFASIILLDKSGTEQAPIRYAAYENERPVFDCTEVKPANQRVSAFTVTGSWLRIERLEVTGVQVTLKGHTQSICFESNGSHNRFEQLRMHDGQSIGIYHVRGADNLFLNCDAWNNWDFTSEDGLGGNVDGFGCHPTPGSTGNVFRGCRAWFNSDDGYDCLGAQEAVTFEHCLAAYNGLNAEGKRLADGNGFKTGGYGKAPASSLPKTIPRHVVRFCISVGNKNSGFYANHHPGGSDWINNSSYRNGANFNMLGRLRDNVTEVDGSGHRLINNLSYHGRKDLVSIAADKCELAGNSFTLGLKLSDTDLVSLDEALLFGERQKNGDLPVSDFLRPAKMAAGAVKGGENDGAAPYIGALEPAAR